MIKLTKKMREHIRNQNKGDIVIDETPWWLVGRQGYTCNLVLVNSAMDVMYMKDFYYQKRKKEQLKKKRKMNFLKCIQKCNISYIKTRQIYQNYTKL